MRQVWDLRAGHSVRSVFGPHICGDSVDVAKGAILTGSYRPEHQLEVSEDRPANYHPAHTTHTHTRVPCTAVGYGNVREEGGGGMAAEWLEGRVVLVVRRTIQQGTQKTPDSSPTLRTTPTHMTELHTPHKHNHYRMLVPL